MRAALLLLALVAAAASSSQPALAQGEPALLYELPSPNEEYGGAFGTALGAIGDVDGDGTPDFAAGAKGETAFGQEYAGRAYVFSGATGALLRTHDGNGGSFFGLAVASAGDLDGDGTDDLAVGAPYEISGGAEVGAAYIYSGATGASFGGYGSPTPMDLGGFGWAVAGVGDVSGDGEPDFAVGADEEESGQVHVFSGVTGLLRTIECPKGVGLGFGTTLAVVGDLTGDGVGEVAVGARTPSLSTSLVPVLDLTTGTSVRTLVNPDPQPNDRFGGDRAVAGVGDVDGDGAPDVAIGAVGAPLPDGQTGAVYLYSGATGEIVRTLTEPGTEPGGAGFHVAGVGDLDGDGTPDVLSTGSAGILAFSGATGAVLAVLTAPASSPGGFGDALAVVRPASATAGAVVAVGAYGNGGEGPAYSGRVFVFGWPDPVAGEAPPSVGRLSVSVAPNPSAGAAQVTLTASSAGAMRVVVVDALGRTVAEVHDGPVAAGAVRVALPAGLAPGVYAVVAEGAGARASARWAVAR